jgi:hypothetical protein
MPVQLNFSREELYDLLWSKPLIFAAVECKVSMPVLRQVCLDNDIPLPWGGYKPTKITSDRKALPPRTDFDFRSAVATAVDSLHFPGETPASFQIPLKLSNLDPLVAAAKNAVSEDYQFYRMPHMLRAGHGELAVRASKDNFDRALRIMDVLIKAWRKRGYRIVNQNKETTIYLREVTQHVSIRETTTVEPPKEKYGSQVHTATGQLAFKMKGWLDREWKDGKVPLETHIHEILDHMEVAARDLEKSWAERKAREQVEAKVRQAEAQRIKEDAEESAAFESLLQEAQRWNQLQVLDKYLDALRQEAPRNAAFEQWLQWVRHRRRLFDPIKQRIADQGSEEI